MKSNPYPRRKKAKRFLKLVKPNLSSNSHLIKPQEKVSNSHTTYDTYQIMSLTDSIKISGRKFNLHKDDKIEYIFLCFMCETRKNIVIVGDKGSGKESVVFAIAEKIVNKNCPKDLFGYDMLLVEADDFIPSLNDESKIASRINGLDSYLDQNPKTIIYVRGIHKLIENELLDLFNSIFRKARIIGTVDSDKFQSEIWNSNSLLSNTFDIIGLDDTKKEDVFDCLQSQIEELQKKHKVIIPKDVFDYIVDIQFLELNYINLLLIYEEVELAILHAKSRSEKKVSKDTILRLRKLNIKGIQEYSQKELASLAYHEAGHVIAGLATNHNVVGVTIIPTSNALGFASASAKAYPAKTLNQLKHNLIYAYGGKIGAKLFGYEEIDGDQSDIIDAAQTAQAIVTMYEMDYFVGNAAVMINYLSEKDREEISEKVKKILQEGRRETAKILEPMKNEIKIIAEALMRRPTLVRKEIDALLAGTYDLNDLHSLDYWLN